MDDGDHAAHTAEEETTDPDVDDETEEIAASNVLAGLGHLTAFLPSIHVVLNGLLVLIHC